MDFKAPRELWNPLSKAVPGKFHGSGGHIKHNCLQVWQIVLIIKASMTREVDIIHFHLSVVRRHVLKLSLWQSKTSVGEKEITNDLSLFSIHHCRRSWPQVIDLLWNLGGLLRLVFITMSKMFIIFIFCVNFQLIMIDAIWRSVASHHQNQRWRIPNLILRNK